MVRPITILTLLFLVNGFAVGKTLTVGVALRLTDKFNLTVSNFRNGIETAKILFEKENPGIKVRLFDFPHEKDLASITKTADKIIQQKIPAVIGAEMSSEAMVLGDLLGPKKTVLVTPTASNPSVTEGKPFVFRICFSDDQVAERLAQYAAKTLGATAIGVLHNVSSPYSDYLSRRFVEAYERTPIPQEAKRAPVFIQKVLKRSENYSDQMQFFVSKKVSHVVLFDFDTDVQRFVLQSARQGFFPIYIGSDGWGSNEYVFDSLVKKSPFGEKFSAVRNVYWKDDEKRPLISDFKREYRAKFQTAPNAWHAIAFDAAWVLFSAMKSAKDPSSGESIQKALRELKALPVLTADHFTFGPQNSPDKSLYVYRISKNGIQYEVTLQ